MAGLKGLTGAVTDAATAAMPDVGPSPTEVILFTGPEDFWTVAWKEILGDQVRADWKIAVPPFPNLRPETRIAMTGGLGNWMPVYFPAGFAEFCFRGFTRTAWGKHLAKSDIQRRPLLGRWVIVETIPKSHWNDPKGYGNGNDPLAKAMGLAKRFLVSWNDLHQIHFPRTAKLLGLPEQAVMLLTAEEWNLIGNLFLWLNAHRSMDLPDLGSTNSWEWCENAYGAGCRLIVGNSGYGRGLAGVDFDGGGRPGDVGFRVLAVL